MLNSIDQRDEFNLINYFKLCKLKKFILSFRIPTVNNSNIFLARFALHRIHNYLSLLVCYNLFQYPNTLCTVLRKYVSSSI